MVTRRATDSPMDPSTPIQAAPDNDASLPQDTPAGTAVDASQRPTLGKLWDSWTSKPENNAAMISFGLNMMQPKYPGETGLSHFANAIGAGAESSTANVAAQEARDVAEQKSDLAERAQQVKEEEGSAYSQYMRNRNTADKLTLSKMLKSNSDWQKWKNSPEPQDDIISGRSRDSVVNYIRSRDPRWKGYNKSDVMNDPGARAEAEKYVRQGPSEAGAGEGVAASGPMAREGDTATGANGQKIVLKGGQWIPLKGAEAE
jgi:heme-degrading monooxygenase HmoA